MKKVCATCGQEKDASEFTFRKDRGTYESRCRTCKNAANRERWARKLRKETESEKESIERDPYGHLAADVIEMAIRDIRAGVTDELLAFFDSRWFEELCDTVGVAPEYIRKHVGE